ncbi:MAG: hypothetical protein GF416_05280 [Candidatus Altiarchaeales archaeon]|nr:hypothetical protein [Candidatus Altiarchaeales archaeon]MBD3416529.1 hypothetical protein [Candidatus Altiarchaeales archaeon]
MKVKVFALVVVLAWLAASISQEQTGSCVHPKNSPDNHITCSLGSGAGTGNLLVTAISTSGDSGPYSPPPGFTVVDDYSGSKVSCALAYKVADGGEDEFTWNYEGSEMSVAWVGEYSGMKGANPLDEHSENDSREGTVSSLASGTTGETIVGDELAIAAFGIGSGSKGTGRIWSDSFTEDEYVTGDKSPGLAVGERILTDRGRFLTTLTWSQPERACASIATFKADVPVCGEYGCEPGEDYMSCPVDCCERDCTGRQDSICRMECMGYSGCGLVSIECEGSVFGQCESPLKECSGCRCKVGEVRVNTNIHLTIGGAWSKSGVVWLARG